MSDVAPEATGSNLLSGANRLTIALAAALIAVLAFGAGFATKSLFSHDGPRHGQFIGAPGMGGPMGPGPEHMRRGPRGMAVGTVQSVDGSTVTVKTLEGETVKVKITSKTR